MSTSPSSTPLVTVGAVAALAALLAFPAAAAADRDTNACPANRTSTPAGPPAADQPRYSRTAVDRPPVLPLGMVALGAALVSNTDQDPSAEFDVLVGLPAGFEVGVDYALPIGGADGRGPLGLSAGWAALDGKLLDVVLRGRVEHDLAAGTWNAAGLGVAATLDLGRVELFFGADQLSIDLGGGEPSSLHVPLGVGLQLTKLLFVGVDTSFTVARLEDGQVIVPQIDTTPLSATAILSLSRRVDLEGLVAADADVDAGEVDAWSAALGLRYYLGN